MRTVACALAVLVPSPSSAVLHEVSAFVQQTAQVHQPAELHKCTEEELQDFNRQHEEYVTKAQAVQTKRRAASAAKFNMTMERFGQTFSEITAPLLSIHHENIRLMSEAMQPLLKDAVEFVTKKLGKPKSGKYDDFVEKFNLTKEIEDVSGRIEQTLPEEQRVLNDALTKFSETVDAKFKDTFPEVLAQTTRMSAPPNDRKLLPVWAGMFVAQKAMPLLLSEAFPRLGKVLPILMDMPQDPVKLEPWITRSVLPALPPTCRNITDIMLRSAVNAKSKEDFDLFSNFKAFGDSMETCARVLLPAPEDSIPEGEATLPAAPRLQCLRCEDEQRLKHATTCGPLCSHILVMCTESFDDNCLHAAASCMDCAELRLEEQKQCGQSEAITQGLAKLRGVKAAIRQGTLEEKGIDALTDAVSSAILAGE